MPEKTTAYEILRAWQDMTSAGAFAQTCLRFPVIAVYALDENFVREPWNRRKVKTLLKHYEDCNTRKWV
jgi:hypothetical protein